MLDAPPKAPRFVLGLGSNQGDRLASLRSATRQCELHDIHVLSRSTVYRTAPVGPPQPDFFNAAIGVETDLDPVIFLTRLLAVEASLGRSRPDPIRWGPRTIDIDVLWYAGGVIELPTLTVPHPRLHERAFALRPLLDVAPHAVDPRSGSPYCELPAALEPLEAVGPL